MNEQIGANQQADGSGHVGANGPQLRRAGRYRLQEVLGVGSFATVFRAFDDRLDAQVVVKLLAENHSLNPEIRERFIAEGRSLRRVESPHVVSVHDIGESERQQPYLVIEYADRGTLAQRITWLRSHGWRASAQEVGDVAANLTSALSAVHAAGLVHRDLSPGNVLIKTRPGVQAASAQISGAQAATTQVPLTLLAPDEMLLVADLGMCKDLALNSGLTVAGGTAGFRPPEQEHGPAVIDQRADLWAMSKLLQWITQGADLPKAFSQQLERGLATNPAKRHGDAQTWLHHIEASLTPPPRTSEPVVAQAGDDSGDAARLGSKASAPNQRRRLIRAALSVAVLAIVFAAGWVAPSLLANSATETVAIEGPTTIAVGEEATYRAVVEADSWVWVLPDGRFVPDAQEVSITPSGAGKAEVILQARGEDGELVSTTLKIAVE